MLAATLLALAAAVLHAGWNLVAKRSAEAGYPLGAQYLVHVGDDGAILLPYTQAKQILDRLKRLCLGRDLPDAGACARFDKASKEGEDMRAAQRLLACHAAHAVAAARINRK